MKSSEALLGGHKSSFRLFARVTQSDGLDPENVAPAVSDEFTVATQRSKPSQKKDVPFLVDPVSILDQIGVQRLDSLRNLGDMLRAELNRHELPSGWPDQVITGRYNNKAHLP